MQATLLTPSRLSVYLDKLEKAHHPKQLNPILGNTSICTILSLGPSSLYTFAIMMAWLVRVGRSISNHGAVNTSIMFDKDNRPESVMWHLEARLKAAMRPRITQVQLERKNY